MTTGDRWSRTIAGTIVCVVIASCSGHASPSANARTTTTASVATSHRTSTRQSSTTTRSTSTTVAGPRPTTYDVIEEDHIWTDTARRTGHNPGRTLPTRLFIPAIDGRPARRDGPFPLFVWAHGFDATVSYFAPELTAWAARGYVVAAPTFPLTSASSQRRSVYDDYVNQPDDVSFVIGKVLALDGPRGDAMPGLVDPLRIGAGGHSLGAVTTLGLTQNRCCIDARVRAAVEIDGSNLGFPDGSLERRPIPTLWMHGDADTTFDVSESRTLYADARAPRFLVVMHGMPHTPFAIPQARTEIIDVVGDFLDAYLRGESGALARLRSDALRSPDFATLSAQP